MDLTHRDFIYLENKSLYWIRLEVKDSTKQCSYIQRIFTYSLKSTVSVQVSAYCRPGSSVCFGRFVCKTLLVGGCKFGEILNNNFCMKTNRITSQNKYQQKQLFK